MATKIGAPQILSLLRAKHSNDVFVDECKDGATLTGAHLRMDAWVMPRSWSKPATTGYEIKVSRSDFLRDEKWQGYLPLCHRLYFVCPPGMIDVAEIPHEAGLIVTSKNGTKLYTKKKAPDRDVQIPESLWRYILMSRVKVTRERDTSRVGYWREWLAERDERRLIGMNVSRSIRRLVDERINRAERENEKLRAENESLAEVRKLLEAVDVTSAAGWNLREKVSRRIRETTAAEIPTTVRTEIDRMIGDLEQARARLDRMQAEAAA